MTDPQEQLRLIGEVVVNRRGRVLDLVRDLPHRDALIPLGHEQLPRRVQNLLSRFLLLPLPPLLDSHNTRPLLNSVNLTPLTYRWALSVSSLFVGIFKKVGMAGGKISTPRGKVGAPPWSAS